jgi:type IV secretory pathway VirB10-like protein
VGVFIKTVNKMKSLAIMVIFGLCSVLHCSVKQTGQDQSTPKTEDSGKVVEKAEAEVKTEEVKAEEKVEAVKTEEKTEEVKTEEKVEAVKTEAVKAEAAKTEEKVEAVKTEEVKTEVKAEAANNEVKAEEKAEAVITSENALGSSANLLSLNNEIKDIKEIL